MGGVSFFRTGNIHQLSISGIERRMFTRCLSLATVGRASLYQGVLKLSKLISKPRMPGPSAVAGSSEPMPDRKIYDVIIVGLGPAGIAAMAKLREKNLSFLALEAAERTGGRIHSTSFAKGIIDLGAEWCHGEENNVVFKMVKDHDVLRTSGCNGLDKVTFVGSNGAVFSKDMNEKLSLLCCEVTMIARERMMDNNNSLGQNFMEVYEEQLKKKKYNNVSKDTAEQVLEWFHKYENSIEASDNWFETSGISYSEYWECDGDPLLHWNGHGYRTILDIIMKSFPDPHKIEANEGFLNKEVVNIKIEDDDEGGEPPVMKVTCKDDSVFFARHIIITVSLGVLKAKHNTLFTPALPIAKINCIQNLAFGTVNKIFMHFETRWWSTEMTWVALLWSQNMKEKFTLEEQWLTHIFGFNSHNAQDNVLCLWITGPNSRHMETLPEAVVKAGVQKLIHMFFGAIYEISPLKGFVRSQWYTNPYTRGSYSFRSMDSENCGASSGCLGDPVYAKKGVPVICFAGEATSIHYYSTVHGAVESGFREAERIATYLEGAKCTNELNSHKVVIVGAGISGLGAAKTLISNGITNIKIIESSSKIGGRIDTLYLENNRSIEMGAQWIHGTENELIRFAESHELLSDIVSYEGDGKYLNIHGCEYSSKLIEDVNDVVEDIVQRCSNFFNNKEDCDFSFGEYLRDEFEKYLTEQVQEEDHSLWRDLLDWHIKFHTIDNACDSIDDLSAKAWGQYDYNGGDSQNHINFKNGFNSVIKKLLEIIPQNAIATSKRVETIDWNTNIVKLYCSDGSLYEADHVIVTVSLGVLKSDHETMFNPALPKNHVTAIESLGFGRIGKIFLEYEKPWWRNNNGFQFIWSSDDCDNYNVVFTEKELDWLKYISGFDVLKTGASNILLGWIGSDGDKIQQEMSIEEVMKQCHKLLEVFTGINIPKPIKCYRSLWGKNLNVKGGFSHVTRKCDKTGVEPFHLAKPITGKNEEIKILLAGEACHSKFFSTVHGAFESGTEQAKKLCKLYTNDKSILV